MLTLIAAQGKNREIGEGNALLWDLPVDMAHFRSSTRGKTVLMGRKTYESIGMLLPNRENCIVSRNREYMVEGARMVRDLEAFLKYHQESADDIFVMGGEQIYTLSLPFAQRISITQVEASFPQADAFFPEYDPQEWKCVERTHHEKDDQHAYSFDIEMLERV